MQVGTQAAPLHRLWQAMVGSEHLSHLLSEDLTGGRVIGADLRDALRRVHDDLGVETVRAHGILCDDLGVYSAAGYDFTGVDRVYDEVLALGYRPVVELGFMPRDLARDPARTVFTYEGIISPPKDWDRWADLVRALTRHLVDRYGRDEVRDHWAFEVWNEANLSVFFSGTPAEYWRLYEVTARAVKDVDPGIAVGGPASAAVGWIDGQLAVDAPVDFLSTHVYGVPPLDLRPARGRAAAAVDRMGDHRDARQPDQRQRVRGDVPVARPALGGRADAGPGALGGLGPLRGTGPAAGADARRVRAAHRRGIWRSRSTGR